MARRIIFGGILLVSCLLVLKTSLRTAEPKSKGQNFLVQKSFKRSLFRTYVFNSRRLSGRNALQLHHPLSIQLPRCRCRIREVDPCRWTCCPGAGSHLLRRPLPSDKMPGYYSTRVSGKYPRYIPSYPALPAISSPNNNLPVESEAGVGSKHRRERKQAL